MPATLTPSPSPSPAQKSPPFAPATEPMDNTPRTKMEVPFGLIGKMFITPLERIMNLLKGQTGISSPQIEDSAIRFRYAQSLLARTLLGHGADITPFETGLLASTYKITQSYKGTCLSFTITPNTQLCTNKSLSMNMFRVFADAIAELKPKAPVDSRSITARNGNITINNLPIISPEAQKLMEAGLQQAASLGV